MTHSELKSGILKLRAYFIDEYYDKTGTYEVCRFGVIDTLEIEVGYGYTGLRLKNGKYEECFLKDDYLKEHNNRIASPLSQLNILI